MRAMISQSISLFIASFLRRGYKGDLICVCDYSVSNITIRSPFRLKQTYAFAIAKRKMAIGPLEMGNFVAIFIMKEPNILYATHRHRPIYIFNTHTNKVPFKIHTKVKFDLERLSNITDPLQKCVYIRLDLATVSVSLE